MVEADSEDVSTHLSYKYLLTVTKADGMPQQLLRPQGQGAPL